MMDKLPCVTCKDLPTCEETLKWGNLGMELEAEGFPVTEISISCPKDGVTYKARKGGMNDG